jgi:isoquinoline 1-oxidoreductase beta subunit
VALKRGIDPMQFRLELLKNTPRGQRVIQRVAEMADWGRKRDNTALDRTSTSSSSRPTIIRLE